MKKLFCLFNKHDYILSEENLPYKLSSNTIIERNLRGWYDFRKCKICGKEQQQRTICSFGKIKKIKPWSDLTFHSKKELERYKKH